MPPHDPPVGSSRRLPMLLLLAAAALFIARIGTGIWEQRHPPELPELVEWRPISAAVAEARTSSKPILYDFSAEWCGPCHVMSAEVFADAKSAHRIHQMFVPVRVLDRSREEGRNTPEVQALLDRFQIEAFPTLVVYVPETGRHESITGYRGRDGMFQQLERAARQVRTQARRDSL